MSARREYLESAYFLIGVKSQIVGQSVKTPRLRPAHVRYFNYVFWFRLKVKEPRRVSERFNEFIGGTIDQVVVIVTLLRKEHHCLGVGVHIDWIRSIVKILSCAVVQKEVVGVVLGAFLKGIGVVGCFVKIHEILQALQVESCVERVNPFLVAGVRVPP